MLENNAEAQKNQLSLLIDLNERSNRIIGRVQPLAIPMTTRHCYISLYGIDAVKRTICECLSYENREFEYGFQR